MIDQISALMAELGPALKLPEVYKNEMETRITWTILRDGPQLIFVDLDLEEPGLLTFSTQVAQVPANPTRVLEALMIFNAQFNQAGTARMALDAAGGMLVYIYTLASERLSLEVLENVVTQFGARAEIWRDLIARLDHDPEDFDPSQQEFLIRV